MAFSGEGAISGAATGAMVGGPWGAVIGGAAGGFFGGSTGGRDFSGYDALPTHVKKGLDALRGMLAFDDLIQPNIGSKGYFSPGFDYWGGKVPKWREQLLGAATTTGNPILRAVSEQVESDFARRGLSTGGAAGAAKARALTDIAAKIALPVEQEAVEMEKQGVQGKYGLQQYAMNLALGQASGMGGPMQEPRRETAFQGLLNQASPIIGSAAGMYYGWGGGSSSGLSVPQSGEFSLGDSPSMHQGNLAGNRGLR